MAGHGDGTADGEGAGVMARFRRLTDAEARSLTRAELLDRVEAEEAYWSRKRTFTAADRAAEREFSRIMHAYLSPLDAIQAAMDTVQGRRSDYWDTRPGVAREDDTDGTDD
jgi:hypothetical protein